MQAARAHESRIHRTLKLAERAVLRSGKSAHRIESPGGYMLRPVKNGRLRAESATIQNWRGKRKVNPMRSGSYLQTAIAITVLSFAFFSSTANAQTFSQARANVWLQQKDWTALANYAAAWTQAQPNSVDAWSDLAVAESTTGLNQPTEAISAFKHVLALQPNFAAAWEGLGVNELAISQAGSAIDALTHATRLEPNNPHFLNNLAAAYRDKGEIASALKTLDSEKLLAERLHDAAVWFVLGNAYSRLHDAANALMAYKETVALRPDFAEAQRNIAALEEYMRPPASAGSASRGPGLNYSTCTGIYANPACAHSQFGDAYDHSRPD
jgi:tetratricopeptide (TPR) repeat protein